VAKAGLPKSPVRKRIARTVFMFFAVIIGIWNMRKRKSVAMYTGLRPRRGSSCSGVKNMGPIP
jgi:hypothetical protein